MDGTGLHGTPQDARCVYVHAGEGTLDPTLAQVLTLLDEMAASAEGTARTDEEEGECWPSSRVHADALAGAARAARRLAEGRVSA